MLEVALQGTRRGMMSSDEEKVAVPKLKRNKSKSVRPWACIDATGNCIVLEVDRFAIMRRVQINLRDYRILHRHMSYPCTILGRERAIVLQVDSIKAIITAEEVLIPDPHSSEDPPFLHTLRRHLLARNEAGSNQGDGTEILDADNDEDDEEHETPFEFRALDVALEAIVSFFDARTVALEMSVYPVLDELTDKISGRNLEKLRRLKSRITYLIARVQQVRDELERLMENDNDLAELYLSRKLARASSTSSEPQTSLDTGRGDENNVEELAMLIEPHFFRMDGTRNRLTNLREFIDDTEDYINIQLDNVRNQLIKFEVILSSASICVSIYSLVAGILGMNIPNSWNSQSYMFKWVVSVTGTLCAVLFVIIMSYARYKKLVGLW